MMESIKEVLVRVQGITEDKAEERVHEAKERLVEGETPEKVLVDLYGSDVESLGKILDPDLQEV